MALLRVQPGEVAQQAGHPGPAGLAIDQIVQHMRAKKPDLATMTGLTAYREEDGIHLTIELGTLPLE